jgi:hypothetical protein
MDWLVSSNSRLLEAVRKPIAFSKTCCAGGKAVIEKQTAATSGKGEVEHPNKAARG